MKAMNVFVLVTVSTLLSATLPATAHDIVRRADSDLPIATSVRIPAEADWVLVGGTIDAAVSPDGQPGDTAAQALAILEKIQAELNAQGFEMSDVVKMTVFLVGDPNKGGTVDYAGLMPAYLKYFGKDAGGIPARTTIEVAGLPAPGALVEIEVIAARSDDHHHDH